MANNATISVTRTQVCLAPKLIKALDREAKRLTRSRSCLIREAVTRFLKETGEEEEGSRYE